jgi:hypothetical protein
VSRGLATRRRRCVCVSSYRFDKLASPCIVMQRQIRPFCFSDDAAIGLLHHRCCRDATAQSARHAASTSNARDTRSSRDRHSTDPETGVASGLPEAAICVQDIDVQCVLQFTLVNAAGCALHRHTSRVIHRLEWSVHFKSRRRLTTAPASIALFS